MQPKEEVLQRYLSQTIKVKYEPYYTEADFKLYLGDTIDVMKHLKVSPNMVFADPPYFLSDGGYTVSNGKIVSVDKGDWDKKENGLNVDEFNYSWLKQTRDLLQKDGTIWISGTFHNIYSIAKQLDELGFKLLNAITWQKTNPPPNFSKRSFTHSTEVILWARKDVKVPHYYNYDLMKVLNEGKQMQDVWKLPAIAPWEKKQGKHPTQKPLSVLVRTILASTKKGDLVLDPFTGSSTTGIAANLLYRSFVGIDKHKRYLDISINRKKDITGLDLDIIINKIAGLDYEIIKHNLH